MFCKKCESDKNEEDFSFKNKKLGTRASCCKECHKLYMKKHYKLNRNAYIDRGKKRNSLEKRNHRAFIISLKTKCIICGETHPACLEFHHKDPLKKEFLISKLYNKKRILEEIKKCNVLCSNCHRKYHWP
jgi:hypothetical protein